MIKQPFNIFISMVLLVVFIGYAIERMFFLMNAERTVGTAVSITSKNDRCGNKSKYSCTKFKASVSFLSRDNLKYFLQVSAGRTRGHDQPIEYATIKINDSIPVVYSPKNPSKVYQDTTQGVWGTPLIILFSLMLFFVTSFFNSRRRTY